MFQKLPGHPKAQITNSPFYYFDQENRRSLEKDKLLDVEKAELMNTFVSKHVYSIFNAME